MTSPRAYKVAKSGNRAFAFRSRADVPPRPVASKAMRLTPHPNFLEDRTPYQKSKTYALYNLKLYSSVVSTAGR